MLFMEFFKTVIYFLVCALMLSISVGLARAKEDKYKMRYSQMDVNHDGIVTRGEWRGDNSLFHNSDWNGDGVLSGNEVTGGARRGDDYDRNHSEERFKHLDQNNDSLVSRDEWDGLIEAFNRLDDNRDEVLVPSEFVNHRVSGTEPFTELDRDRNGFISRAEWNGNATTFNHLDKNHDGQWSRAEFPNPLK